jgi:predicted RNA-binding Zn-ribbon protein involved in translation (DUF1610 family)
MDQAHARLLCPECGKQWEALPGDLPGPERTFHCPNCHASRRLAEFTRTSHDLSVLKQLG